MKYLLNILMKMQQISQYPTKLLSEKEKIKAFSEQQIWREFVPQALINSQWKSSR